MQLNETTVQKRRKEKLGQMNTGEDVDKAAVAQVHKYIARFWYQAGLPFNLIQSPYFKDMVEAIGAYGKHLPVPSLHDIRGPLLSKELEYTDSLVKPKKKEWSRHGCTIMLDGWTDHRQRTIINVLVSSLRGTIFVKSIDVTCFVKTEKKLFKLLDLLVDEIGEEHVVRVVTDNGSNYVAAGKMLMEKRKHLFWTPCAAQCINLMLEDIGKLPSIKETIQKGISLVGYIYSHTFTLNLLETFTNKKELIRPAVTRFATSFLTLERVHEEKDNLRSMFTSNEWVQNTLSKDAKGREATEIVMMTPFWENVVYILKVMEPLVQVLRLVVGETKLAMGYIYEAMEKAKETIRGSFEKNEQRYGDIFNIIDDRWNCQLHSPMHAAGHILNPAIYYDNKGLEFDFKVTKGLHDCIDRLVPNKEDRNKILRELSIYKNSEDRFGMEIAQRQRQRQRNGLAPALWWELFGLSAPTLQQLAIKILGSTCSAFGCESNQTVFEKIHSKKRNSLEHQKMHDLVYVKYNQKLHERCKYNRIDTIDPIMLNDVDECNEWLVGEMDDVNGVGRELVLNDGSLDWDTVNDALGTGEPRTHTRSKKRKEPPTFSSCVRGSKKDTRAASTSRKGKCKLAMVVEERDIDVESEDKESEQENVGIIDVPNYDEEEGSTSLDANEDEDEDEDDYVGEDFS